LRARLAAEDQLRARIGTGRYQLAPCR
jgi:hypothetical protein